MSYIKQALAESSRYFEERYKSDLEKNRKGDFTVILLKDGKPFNGSISYSLKRHDFDFGCNIFMLDQYEDKEQEALYHKNWENLFNTAVVPLYWEGTEPREKYLRYRADSDNDIYRRPSPGRVIEYCKAKGIALKGHPLFWHEFIAHWLPESWDELYPLIEKRFKEISDLFGKDIPVFDCVNEPSRIWDMTHEHRNDGYKMVVPPNGYLEQLFALGEKYFGENELILNEATGAAFSEFKGIYGGYFQLADRLLKEGLKIDRIGLQCHISDWDVFKNIYDSRRLYEVLDGYASLGRPLVLSEIGLSCEDEEIQATAAERIYKVCFSHEGMSGIFWWNLDDNGILCSKDRNAGSENLPYGGLCRNGRQKAAYKALDRLINHEWKTAGRGETADGKLSFRGFYGSYEILVNGKKYTVSLNKNGDRNKTIEV